MINLLYLFLPLVLYLGIITSYTDIKEGKIRNKHLLTAFIFSIILYLSLFLLQKINLDIILMTLINFGIGAVVAFFLWFLGMWSAGDAKLFAVYLFMIPVFFYKLKTYTFLTLLINVIIPAAAFFIIVLLIKTKIQEKLTLLKKFASFKSLVHSILLVFCTGWIIELIFSLLKIPSNLIFNMILILGIDKLIRKVWKYNVLYIYALISVIRIVFQWQKMLTFNFWISFLIFTVGFMILRGLIFDMSFFLFSKEIMVKDLKLGMILAENIVRNKRKNKIAYQKVLSSGLFSTSQLNNPHFLLTHSIEGLTQQDINLLNKLHIKNIKIQQTIPFAPFMFFGALIILIFGVDVISIFYLIF